MRPDRPSGVGRISVVGAAGRRRWGGIRRCGRGRGRGDGARAEHDQVVVVGVAALRPCLTRGGRLEGGCLWPKTGPTTWAKHRAGSGPPYTQGPARLGRVGRLPTHVCARSPASTEGDAPPPQAGRSAATRRTVKRAVVTNSAQDRSNWRLRKHYCTFDGPSLARSRCPSPELHVCVGSPPKVHVCDGSAGFRRTFAPGHHAERARLRRVSRERRPRRRAPRPAPSRGRRERRPA
jgi:hypothetical protein